MKVKINKKKAVIWGIVVYIFNSIVSNVLWQNPVVAGIFDQYAGHPTMKPMENFGGVGNWVMLNMFFGVFLIAFFVYLYLVLHESIPGKAGWKKGLYFGLIFAAIKAIPEAFNQFMLFNYPNILIIVQLINTFLGLVIFGAVVGIVFSKFNVVEKVDD